VRCDVLITCAKLTCNFILVDCLGIIQWMLMVLGFALQCYLHSNENLFIVYFDKQVDIRYFIPTVKLN
jgi:hypothetical protein